MVTAELCTRDVVIVRRDEFVMEAARLMRQFHVGAVIVVEGDEARRRPIGILTDRDIVLRVLAEGRDAACTSVGDVMSTDLLTIGGQQGVYETLEPMRAKGVRRAPVVDSEGILVGILSVDDILDLLSVEIRDMAALIQREQTREARRPTIATGQPPRTP